MKMGKSSLVELAQALEAERAAKRDYVADTRNLLMSDMADAVTISAHGTAVALRPNDLAHSQIGERVGIPKKYYDRMREEAPNLLAENVNHWFTNAPERRMIRTLDGKLRAFLSDRYQRIDNVDVAEVALPVLLGAGDIRVASCDVTETRLYIKAVALSVEGEIKRGDVVRAGVCISNSEVGLGAVKVERFIERLVCTNGLIVPDSGMRKHHIGARADMGDAAYITLTDETIAADDRAILLKTRDVIRSLLEPTGFAAWLEDVRSTTERKVDNPVQAVEVLAKRGGLAEAERNSVLRHLIEGGDLSQWGLVNAVTRSAEDSPSYDRATELEAFGGKLLNLAPTEWREMAMAA